MIRNKTVFQQMCNLIGSTPLSQISFTYKDQPFTIYVKHEHYNLTGSVKDRMALHILYNAYKFRNLDKSYTICEATSGNTGIAFSAIGRALGHKVRIYMPEWMSKERVNLIKSFGADIVLVTREQGGFLGSIALAKQYAAEHEKVFLPSQFSNLCNLESHFMTTGPEIWTQCSHINKVPDAFVAGVGTGGTIMGVGKYLKEKNPNVKIYPLEPSNSPTLKTGHKVGKHRIEGISDEFIPELIDFSKLDDIIDVDDGDAILMAQKLAMDLGYGVGISSGANFLGALKACLELGPEATVVTMFPDDNKKYLSTDLMRDEPIQSHFMSPYISQLNVDQVIQIKDLDHHSLYSVCDCPLFGSCKQE